MTKPALDLLAQLQALMPVNDVRANALSQIEQDEKDAQDEYDADNPPIDPRDIGYTGGPRSMIKGWEPMPVPDVIDDSMFRGRFLGSEQELIDMIMNRTRSGKS